MSTKPVAQAETLAGKVLADVAALVRELDPGELSLRGTTEEDLQVGLTVRHTAAFSIATAAGRGPLPASAEELSSRAALRVRLERLLAEAHREAGDLIDKWAADEGGEYRAVLPAERCLNDRPLVGVEEVCGACGGHKQVECPACKGARRVTCPTCGGHGRTRCSQCDNGSKSCWSCHGQGFIEKTELELNYMDQQNTMNQQRQVVRRVPCSSCGATGRQPCGACNQGSVICPTCGGNLQVACSRCGASGVVPCDPCAATGVVHQTGWIQCAVNRGVRAEVDSANPEDQQTLRERTPFDQIGRLATNSGGIWANRGVLLSRRDRNDMELTLRYSASVLLECVEAAAGGERITIRAYGPCREIYNYHNLIGRLLEADLASLEKALQGHSLFKARAGSSLAAVMQRFLASEANGKIAESPPGVPPTLAPLVAAEMLGPEYIRRAAAAMSKAAPRLYGPLVLPLALWGTAGLTAIFWIVRTNFRQWSPDQKFFTLLALTAAAWFAAEAKAQSGLRGILGAPVYQRLKGQFAKARNPYRLLPAAGFAFAWYITFLIFRLILHFRYGYPVTFFPPG